MGKSRCLGLLLIINLLFLSCKKNNKLDEGVKPVVQILEREYFFGNAKKGDTIKKTFLIKNISSNPYRIDKIGLSCGCTTVTYTENSIGKGEIAKVSVMYIPMDQEHDTIMKSIVVSDNTDEVFQMFYIKGKIID